MAPLLQFFKAFCFHPDGTEFVTAGTDKRITYWDALTGEALRRLEATQVRPGLLPALQFCVSLSKHAGVLAALAAPAGSHVVLRVAVLTRPAAKRGDSCCGWVGRQEEQLQYLCSQLTYS